MHTGKRFKAIPLLIYVLFAVFYFWMAAQIPYTHDDWDWGLDVGMQQFLHATVNSRYMGNFFEIIMTRYEFLKIILMGSCFFLIPFILSHFASKELKNSTAYFRVFLFIICNGLLLSMNHNLWAQSYGWVAGFSSFAISSCFLMLWIHELLCVISGESKDEKNAPVTLIVYFIICLCGQLFLENITIYCFVLAIVLCVLHLMNYKKLPLRIISMLIGSFLGLIIMFSSDLYGTLLQEGTAVGNYRQIPLISSNGISDFLYRTLTTVIHLGIRLYSLNIVLNVTILLLFIMFFLYRKPEAKYRKLFLWADILLIIALSICYTYDAIADDHAKWVFYCDFFVSVVYFIAILLQIFNIFQKKDRITLLSLWISAPLIIAPLVVTTEVGYRLFFTSNIFIILFALILLIRLKVIIPKIGFKAIQITGVSVTCVLICFFCIVYANIGECKRVRHNIINTALEQNADTIILPEYPFSDFLHSPDPKTVPRLQFFKEFYGIPDSIEVIFD